MHQFKEGEPCLAYYKGEWRNGTYHRKGKTPGEHWVAMPDLGMGKYYTALIINNEIQYFLD